MARWPVQPLTGGEPEVPAGRIEWTSPTGDIHLVMDSEEFEFYIEAAPNVLQDEMRSVLSRCFAIGLVLIEEDECQPEINEHGHTRIYMVPVHPVDDTSLVVEAERSERGFGTAGALAWVAALVMGCSAFAHFSDAALEVLPG